MCPRSPLPAEALRVRSSGVTRPQAAVAARATAQRASAACAFVVAGSEISIGIPTVGFGPVPQSPFELRAWSQAALSPLALLNETQFFLAYAWLLPPAASAALLLPLCVFFVGVGVDLLRGRPETFAVAVSR